MSCFFDEYSISQFKLKAGITSCYVVRFVIDTENFIESNKMCKESSLTVQVSVMRVDVVCFQTRAIDGTTVYDLKDAR